jgi:hypothetical protein
MAYSWLYWILVAVISEALNGADCLKVSLRKEHLESAFRTLSGPHFAQFLHSVTNLNDLAQIMDPLEHGGNVESFAVKYNLR